MFIDILGLEFVYRYVVIIVCLKEVGLACGINMLGLEFACRYVGIRVVYRYVGIRVCLYICWD